jgi:RNA polymerase sigma factor (TIGR02999 family)
MLRRRLLNYDKNIVRNAINPVDDQIVSALLVKVRDGDAAARDELFTLVHLRLKRLARILMSRERSTHGYGKTGGGLVSELWIRLNPKEGIGKDLVHVNDLPGLLRVAMRDMRQILIDDARKRGAISRPQSKNRASTTSAAGAGKPDRALTADRLDVREAMQKLAAIHPDSADALDLKHNWGFTIEEAAAIMDVSVSEYRRIAKHGEAWIADCLAGSKKPASSSGS